MKTLIINGSPRKGGDTVSLIDILRQNLLGEVNIVNTYYDNIRPCNDCRYCWTHSSCAIKDEMDIIYRNIQQVDNIVIASPIYFSELTGSLLNFASRLQFLYVSRMIRKDSLVDSKSKAKNGAVILVGGGDGSADSAIRTARILLRQMGCTQLLDSVCSLQTNTIPAKEDEVVIAKVKALADMLRGSAD